MLLILSQLLEKYGKFRQTYPESHDNSVVAMDKSRIKMSLCHQFRKLLDSISDKSRFGQNDSGPLSKVHSFNRDKANCLIKCLIVLKHFGNDWQFEFRDCMKKLEQQCYSWINKNEFENVASYLKMIETACWKY